MENPTVFISYSWDEESHKDWVLSLANRLLSDGIDVILDRYELKLGGNLTSFIENSINSADRIITIFTPNYKLKADKRKGGVGYEYSIINVNTYNNISSQRKIIPVLRSGSMTESIPDFMKQFIHLDLSNDENFEAYYGELLREIYNEPELKKPKIGERPLFRDQQKFYLNEKHVNGTTQSLNILTELHNKITIAEERVSTIKFEKIVEAKKNNYKKFSSLRQREGKLNKELEILKIKKNLEMIRDAKYSAERQNNFDKFTTLDIEEKKTIGNLKAKELISAANTKTQFSAQVQDAIKFSREEAIRLGTDYTGPEHILLGLIKGKEGFAISLLGNLSVNLQKLKLMIEKSFKNEGVFFSSGNIPFTRQSEKILKVSYLECKILKSDIIDTEHLLLSILRDEDNFASQVLSTFDINYNVIRDKIFESIAKSRQS